MSVFADDLFIPKWFYTTQQYWKDGLISDREFADAISYLQNLSLLRLESTENDAISKFLVTDSLIRQEQFGNSRFSECSAGWYVTGYYTPLESDYDTELITLNIDGTLYKFDEEFINEIKIEGWGKTRSGKYLGWYDEAFHFSDNPLDSSGNILSIGIIAVDQSIIDTNSNVTIPSLPPPWDNRVFVGSDVGSAIIGKHVDVYTGEGKDAFIETYRITGYNNVVCRERN